jgi:hypothetical protein
MKYFRVTLMLALLCVLFCAAPASHTQGFDFHATVLDPFCSNATECQLHAVDLGVPFPVSLGAGACIDAGVSPLPSGPFGCFVGTNLTGNNITSFVLDFAHIPSVTGCDTNISGVTPSVAFSVSSCVVDQSGGYDLTFTGGTIVPGHSLIVLEEGVDPSLFIGTGTLNPTPEPDSFLLLATGVMMIGLYMGTTRRERLFGFLKK